MGIHTLQGCELHIAMKIRIQTVNEEKNTPVSGNGTRCSSSLPYFLVRLVGRHHFVDHRNSILTIAG
jgi:hypothetical protein